MKNRTNLIFCHKLIKAIADSMVKVFIPLIILKNGGSLWLSMIYLVSYYFLCGIFNVVLKKFLQKYGVIAMILHAVPLIILQFLLTAKISWWLCLIIAVFAAMGQVLYSVPLNILFAFTDKEVNVAKFQIATNVGKLIFTIASGFIIGSSFKDSILVLSIVGTVLYLLSAVPIVYGYNLLKSNYNEIALHPPVVDKKSYKIFNVYHGAFSICQSVLDVVVPLYLFVENLTFEAVAIVMAAIEVCKIAANLFAKFLIKKNKSAISICFSAVLLVIGSVLMLTIKNAVVLYVCSCVIAVSFPLMFVPMFSCFVKKLTKENNRFDGMSYRDVYIMFSKEIMFVPYFVIPSLIGQFVVGMISAAVMAGTAVKILVAKQDKNVLE